MDRKKDIKRVENFKKELKKKIDVRKIIFFGSRVKGKPKKYSDFDLIIVSPYFQRKKILDRPLGFYKYWKIDYPVDFLCYTPKEFKEMSEKVTLVRDAIREGIEIN